MAIEVADLRIDVETTGTAQAAAELGVVDQAIDDVDGNAVRASSSVAEFGSALKVLGIGAAVVGGAPLIGVAGAVGAIAGGAIAAVPGVVGLGGAFAYLGLQSLKAETGTSDLGDAFRALTDAGTPLGRALADLKERTGDMSSLFLRFVNDVGPKAINHFSDIVKVLENNMRPALRALSRETVRWMNIFVESAKRVAPVLDDFFRDVSKSFARLARAFEPAIRPSMEALGTALKGLSDGLIALFKPMIPFIEETGKGFADLFRTLGENLGKIAHTLGPVIEPFFKTLNDLLDDVGTALDDVAKGIVKAWKGFGPLVGAVGDLLVALSPLAEPLGEFISTVSESLVPVIETLTGVINAIMGPLKLFLGIWSKIAGFIMSPLGAALKFLDDHVLSLKDHLAETAIESGVFDEALAPLKAKLDAQAMASHTAADKIERLGGSFEFAQQAFTDSERKVNLVTGALERLADQAHVTGRELVRAFIKQQKAIADYESNWDAFIARDPPQQLVDALKEMGLDGAQILAALATVSDRKFNQIRRAILGPSGASKQFTQNLRDLKTALDNLPDITKVQVDFVLTGRGHPGGGGQILPPPLDGTAKGGVFTKPTVALIGEAGPEAVIPLAGQNAQSFWAKHGQSLPMMGLATGQKSVKMRGVMSFDWRRGIADLEGALVDADRVRGW